MSQIYITPISLPGEGTVTSISQGTGITLTPNPITTTGTVALTIPVVIANGGTNNTSYNTDGVIYYDGTKFNSTTVGTSGNVLTSNGAGFAPTFQAPAASSISISGDSGGALTGSAFTFTGGTTGLTFSGAGTTETVTGTLVVANGGTGRATLTNHGLLVGAGTAAITQLANATNGQIPIGSTGADPVLATITPGANVTVTNGAGTITVAANTGAQTISVTPVVFAQSPYTVLSTDYFLAVDVTGGAITILLPNAPASGRVFLVKDVIGSASTKNITVTTVGGTVAIDGSTSFILNSNYESINVVFDGTEYLVF